MKISICFISILIPFIASASDSERIKKECPGGVKPQEALMIKSTSGKKRYADGLSEESIYFTPSKTDGVCFRIRSSEFVYFYERNQAIYNVINSEFSNDRLIFVHFGDKKAPLKSFHGTIKGGGVYKYRDERGFPRQIAGFRLVD